MNRNRLSMNNIGGAFNLYNGSGPVTSVTLGLAYNKLIDHNIHQDSRGQSALSISDYFAYEMNRSGIAPGDVDNLIANGGRDEYMPEMLAYQAYIIDHVEGDGYVNWITPGAGAYADFSRLVKSEGSTGQFDLALGMNLSNKLYLGLGFGIQDIYYKAYDSYFEEIVGNVHGENKNSLRDLEYLQNIEQRGSAWNFKIGAILRPVEALRIGVAFHTPTYITMDWENRRQAFSRTGPDSDPYDNESVENILYGTYQARTPMRLMGGISYTFFDTAILSLDYERVWYNRMKMFWDGNEDTAMTSLVQDIYKPANNLRVGLELNVAPNWFVRGGFAYYEGMYNAGSLRTDLGLTDYKGQMLNYSGGFGYRTAGWGIDLAYVYMDRKDAPTYAYLYKDSGGNLLSKPYGMSRLRHNVTATLTVRF